MRENYNQDQTVITYERTYTKAKTLVCTHAMQCFALKELADEKLNGLFFGIDELRH